MLPALLMFNDNRALDVQVIEFILKDLKKRGVLSSVNAYTLKLVSEVLFDGQFLEGGALHDDVVLALEDEAVDDEVLTLKQVAPLQELHQLLALHRVITLLDVHRHEIQLWTAVLFPLVDVGFVAAHDVVVVEDGEAELVLEHLGLQVLEHHVRVAEAVVRGHALQRLVALVLSGTRRPTRDLAVEGHDRPERVALGDQTQFAWRLLVVLAESLHLLLFH